MSFRLSAVLVCAISALYGQASRRAVPRFEDYRIGVYTGKAAPPDYGEPGQYTGTDLRCFDPDQPHDASERPNFAGHFVIGRCSCGSGCHYLFLWDVRTGKLYRNLPFGELNVGPYLTGDNASPVEYSGESFRADSRLLIIEACQEGTCDCGKKYYLWTGSTFRIVLKLVSRLPPNCGK